MKLTFKRAWQWIATPDHYTGLILIAGGAIALRFSEITPEVASGVIGYGGALIFHNPLLKRVFTILLPLIIALLARRSGGALKPPDT